MATHKSAEKRARQSARRSKINQQTVAAVRTAERKLRTALSAAEVQTAQTLLVEFSSTIQRAVVKGRLHARNAQRRIGRLATAVHRLSAGNLTSNQARQASKRS